MIQSQGGDTAAYSQLLTEIAPYIRKKIRFKLGAWEELEDLVQEILIAIHKSKRTFHPTKPFLPWLGAVIRYKMIDQIKIRQKRIKKEVISESIVTNAPSPQNDPVEREVVSEALNRLPKELRQAIYLTKVYGLSTVQAAKQQNTSPEAMRKRVSRAYTRLRKDIEKDLHKVTY